MGQALRVYLWYHPYFCMIVTDFGEWTQIKAAAIILQTVDHRVFPQGLCSLSFIIAPRGQSCGHGGKEEKRGWRQMLAAMGCRGLSTQARVVGLHLCAG